MKNKALGWEKQSKMGNIPVLGHREDVHERKPAGSEALQGADAVVVQMQLSK